MECIERSNHVEESCRRREEQACILVRQYRSEARRRCQDRRHPGGCAEHHLASPVIGVTLAVEIGEVAECHAEKKQTKNGTAQ